MSGRRFNSIVFDVFQDYKRRRDAIIRALTSEFEEFLEQCDPEKGELCLYGRPDGRWVVNPPEEEVPPDLPEPFSFINLARQDMQENKWISYVAVHSDAWLVSVAFFQAGILRFDKTARELLFSLTNDLPTVSEVVENAKSVTGLQDKCGICKQEGKEIEFWICCDTCDTWFHGQCVKITPLMAERIKYYKCPPCAKAKKAPAR